MKKKQMPPILYWLNNLIIFSIFFKKIENSKLDVDLLKNYIIGLKLCNFNNCRL